MISLKPRSIRPGLFPFTKKNTIMHPKNNTDMTISELRNEIEILEIELSELKQELLQKKKAGGTHPADLQWYQDQITDIEYKLVSLELAIRKK